MGVKTLNELEDYWGRGKVANRQVFGHHCATSQCSIEQSITYSRSQSRNAKYEPDG